MIEDDRVVHVETLLKGLGRIRDIAVGCDGVVHLLLEHASGGRILGSFRQHRIDETGQGIDHVTDILDGC